MLIPLDALPNPAAVVHADTCDILESNVLWKEQLFPESSSRRTNLATMLPSLSLTTDRRGKTQHVKVAMPFGSDDGDGASSTSTATPQSSSLTRWMQATVTELPSSQLLLVHLVDIDEGMRAKEQWTAILETTFDGFWDYHIPQEYEYMSPRFWDMFGYQPHEKKHKPSEWMGMIHPDDLKASMQDLGQHFASGGKIPYCRETRYKHKDGTHWVWVLCRGKVIEWGVDPKTGQATIPLRMIGTHTDITHQKLKQQEEREWHAKIASATEDLRRFVHHVNAPVFGVDTNQIVNTWNDRMQQITGIAPEQVLGKPLGETPVRQAVGMTRQALQSQEGTNLLLEIPLPQAEIQLLVNTTTRKNSNGKVLGCYCFGLDMTEIRTIQESLVQERERAAAEETLNDFLAHEVRNPLATAISSTQFVQEGLAKPHISRQTVLQDVAVVQHSLDYIQQLLTSMLDLSTVFDNKLVLRPRIVNLRRDILKPVHAMVKERMDPQVQLQVVEEGMNCRVTTDDLRVRQALVNLLTNSVKFSNQGFIRLIYSWDQTEDGKHVLQIVLEDSGPGIPKGKHPQLFQQYVDLSQQAPGNGLGICLTEKLVELMQGSMKVDETYDSGISGCPGIRFVVSIPMPIVASESSVPLEFVPATKIVPNSLEEPAFKMAKTQGSGSTAAAAAGGASFLAHKRVLIVDDDRLIRKLLSRRLLKLESSLQVDQAESGEKALEMVMEQSYDLILMDHFMPLCGGVLTGDQVIARIRQQQQGGSLTTIIVGSSGNDVSAAHTAAGADFFWLKPVPKDDILVEDLRTLFESKMSGLSSLQ